MHVVAIMGGSLGLLLKNAAKKTNIDLTFFQNRWLADSPEKIPEALSAMKQGDAILLFMHSEAFWEEIREEIRIIGKSVPLICAGDDPSHWALSSTGPEVTLKCQQYMMYGGEENFTNLLHYLEKTLLGKDVGYQEPIEIPFQGIYHPDAPGAL